MADLAKIKRNVGRMVEQNAPESDIDEYINSEGVTLDQVRSFSERPNVGSGEGLLRQFNDTLTFGFWDKAVSAGKAMLGQGDFAGNLQREQARTKAAEHDTIPAIAGRTAGMTLQGLATLPAMPAVYSYQAAKEAMRPAAPMLAQWAEGLPNAARYGAAYGSAEGAGHSSGDATNQLLQVGKSTAAGAILGPIIHTGGYGVSAGLAARDARNARLHQENVARADELRAAGVTDPLPAAVSGSNLLGGATRFTGAGIGGSPVGEKVRSNVAAIGSNVDRTLRGPVNNREAGDLGADVQEILRRNLNDRTRPDLDVSRMTPEELNALTGMVPAERNMPRPPVVDPVPPQPVQRMTRDDYLNQRAAEVPAVDPAYPRPRMTPQPQEAAGPPAPDAAAIQALRDLHTERTTIGARIENDIRVRHDDAIRQTATDPFISAPYFDRFRPLFDDYAAGGPLSDRTRAGLRALDARMFGNTGPRMSDELRSKLEIYRMAQTTQRERNAAFDRLKQIESEIPQVEARARATAQANAEAAYARQLAEARAEAERMTQLDRQRAEAEALAATEARRNDVREREGMFADARVENINAQRAREAQAAAEQATREAQARADAEHAARVGAIRSTERPFVPGRSQESYKTEFDAAYQTLYRDAPQGHLQARNPLGAKGSPDTATARLLADIGEEARRNLKLKGFKGEPFDDSGAIKPDLLAYIQRLAGPDIGQRIARLSEARASGQAAPGPQGLHDLRSAVRKSVEDAVAHNKRTGEPLSVDAAFLKRLVGTLTEDMHGSLRASGPDGVRASQQMQNIDAQFSTWRQDTVRPLRSLFGENVTPVQAMDRLVKAAETGDTRMLAAYMKVMADKETPTRGAASVVLHMTDGGRDMGRFVERFGEINPAARSVLFAGPQGQALERELNRYVSAYRRLEPYAKAGKVKGAFDPTRVSHLATAGMFIANWPIALTAVAGNAAVARVVASPRLLRWITTLPTPKGPQAQSQALDQHFARLSALAAAGSDEDKAVANALLSVAKQMFAQETATGAK